MNKSLLNILWAMLLPFVMSACSPEDYGDANIDLVPSITNYADSITVTVDQTTNLVTLQMNSKGVMPVWIFEDGTTSNENGYEMTVRLAGTYTLEVKVANKYGISDGSVTRTYTLNNTLLDEDLITNLCGGLESSTKEWVWNSEADGHFGCGESYDNPINWWSCAANGKDGWGMYDDIFTFGYNGGGTSGSYIYNPGDGGTVYVNTGCTFSPLGEYNTNDGNDYMATVAIQNTTWTLVYEGNDLYLEFPAGTLVGYVPNEDTYNAPKFKIISLTSDKIDMVCYNGSIAWKYEFLSKEVFDSGADAEIDGSKYSTAIVGTWVWDETTAGHFGCGSTALTPTDWWSCGAEEKAGYGLYDDTLTFDASGNYTFNPGAGGTIYCNWATYSFMDPTMLYYSGDGSTDFQYPVSSQTTTYTITNDGSTYYLEFPAKTYVSYLPSEEVYNNPKYQITKMTNSLIEFSSLGTGISWRYRFVKVN
jgi:hypothetical protein